MHYGPFQVDACADNAGRNAQCEKFWCSQDSYAKHSWAGMTVWCNPPFEKIAEILDHATASYYKFPKTTRALLVLPDWPDAKWWPTLVESSICHCVGYYPAGTQLFTAPATGNGKHKSMGPTRWGVIMVLLGRTDGAGLRIPWAPWPPPQPPTIVNMPAAKVEPEEVAEHVLSPGLTALQQEDMQALLQRYADGFATGSSTGRTNLVTHRIDTGDAPPIKARPHRQNPASHQVIRENVQSMLASGIIQPSGSNYASNVVLVKKKDGTMRVCIDYRPLNAVTCKDSYPLPRTDEVLNELAKAQWFSKLDLKSGYWQIVVDPEDRHKTAFMTRDGLYEFMPFGLTSAPATFQRLMDRVLSDLLWHKVMVYLDDIIIYSETWQQHLTTIDDVLRRLRAAGLKASPGKCEFGQTSMQYLGHIVTREGILPDEDNVKAIMDCKAPETLTELRSFYGMVQYYGNYIPHLAEIAVPLFKLYKKGVEFTWTTDCQEAFETIKQSLVSPPVLRRPDPTLPYILQTDWSPTVIGAILAQEDSQGEEHPIAFASKLLKGPELRYSATEGECFAVVSFVEHFRPYLCGVPFTLEVDHWSLKWLMTNAQQNGKLARWALKLQKYDLAGQPTQ